MPLPKGIGNYSYANYLNQPEDEKMEIIDGTPYIQPPPSPIHQLVSGELHRQLANYLQDKPYKAYPAPFCVRLINGNETKNEDIKNVVEPDISIICDKSKLDETGCNGAPDMIIEITSPSSVKMDRLIKFNQYEKSGVKEYWIVEPQAKLVTVFIIQQNQRYGRPDIYTENDKIKASIFPNLQIDLKSVFEVIYIS